MCENVHEVSDVQNEVIREEPPNSSKLHLECKAEVVRLCQAGRETIRAICQRLDLTDTAVRGWVRQAEVDAAGGIADVLTTVEREKLQRLRRECKQVTMEREIPREAAARLLKPTFCNRADQTAFRCHYDGNDFDPTPPGNDGRFDPATGSLIPR